MEMERIAPSQNQGARKALERQTTDDSVTLPRYEPQVPRTKRSQKAKKQDSSYFSRSTFSVSSTTYSASEQQISPGPTPLSPATCASSDEQYSRPSSTIFSHPNRSQARRSSTDTQASSVHSHHSKSSLNFSWPVTSAQSGRASEASTPAATSSSSAKVHTTDPMFPSLFQPQKADLRLFVKHNPAREWHGTVQAPHSTAVDDSVEDDDLRSAVPVQVLSQAPVLAATEQADPTMTIGRAPVLERFEDGTPIVFNSTQMEPKTRLADPEGKLRKQGRRKILAHKHLMQTSQLGINGLLIFATWWWSSYYYIILPLIMATVALNVVMAFSVVARRIWNVFSPEEVIMPAEPESMVWLIPCYNETREELTKSLDSLVAQQKVEEHKKAIMIVCDGKVRGPGMEKTTADYLLQNILLNKTERKYIKSAYTAWDQQPMDVVLQRGTYKGMPYVCIIKQQNQGKRDGLIMARSFLYNFNRRDEAPRTIFSPVFFNDMASFMLYDAGINHVVHIVGMDADTVFHEDCIYEILQQSRYEHTVGVCGYVAVDFKGQNYTSPWRLYQSAEYTIAQALRRLHQSMVTHKVSCLPGCCQLLKICEETCGDEVLVDLFGYCPEITDGLLTQIRATASEDRNHVCHLLSARPQSQTRQALKALAYTDVPQSWSVFLSQRRRWTLGATSNDWLLVSAPGVQWFERILAFVNVMTWFVNPFIFASFASFIFATTIVPAWIILCFVSVMLIPIAYYLTIPLWLCKAWRERIQFWMGCCIYILGGPFINIAVLIYATIYMDNFRWGKTRKVIADSESGSSKSELERLEEGSSSEQSDSTKEVVAIAPPMRAHLSSGPGSSPRRDLDEEERNVGR